MTTSHLTGEQLLAIARNMANKAAAQAVERQAALTATAKPTPPQAAAAPVPAAKPSKPTAAQAALSPAMQAAIARMQAAALSLPQHSRSTMAGQPASNAAALALEQAAAKLAAQAAAHNLQHGQQPSALAAAVQTAPSWEWNEEQARAIELATGKDGERGFCLVGAAGTGKTTTVRAIIEQLMASYVEHGIDPYGRVALAAFTNRAVRNVRKAISGIEDASLRGPATKGCATIHKLLKFQPCYYDTEVAVTDKHGRTSWEPKRVMRFEPTYRAQNPLYNLELVVVDEASMVPLNLWKQLLEACPNARFIFIGDLNQLKPVGFLSILGFKLAEVPVVELHRVYRQAMASQIVAFQHQFTLQGKLPGSSQLATLTEAGKELAAQGTDGAVEFIPLTKQRSGEDMCYVWAQTMYKRWLAGEYQPVRDILLLPNNPADYFGTQGVNKWLAQLIGEHEQRTVYEVLAGHPNQPGAKQYWAVGDFVTYDREEWYIAAIDSNPKYSGPDPQPPGTDLLRTGGRRGGSHKRHMEDEEVSFDMLLNSDAGNGERKLAASHIIKLVPAGAATNLQDALEACEDSTEYATLSSKGELKAMEWGYAISVHKSQGSEWQTVYMCITNNHTATVCSRELVYTGFTRAKSKLTVWYSPDSSLGAKDNSIAKAIGRCSIPGVGWKAKLKFFNERREEYEAFMRQPTQYGPDADNTLGNATAAQAATKLLG